LFQGQEFAASAPFLYFADHVPELARKVRAGRAAFLAQFASLASRELAALLPDPAELATFERCKLDLAERETHDGVYTMHKDLISLRRTDPVFRAHPAPRVDGAVLGAEAFLLRFFSEDGAADRLLVVNLGPDLGLNPAPEPLLAPPAGAAWSILWSSEHPRYGGSGTPLLETRRNWRIPGHATVVLSPSPAEDVEDLARGGDEITEEEETRREVLRAWGHLEWMS
jgi:maltooligosyltrehalose trehalohydrolase